MATHLLLQERSMPINIKNGTISIDNISEARYQMYNSTSDTFTEAMWRFSASATCLGAFYRASVSTHIPDTRPHHHCREYESVN